MLTWVNTCTYSDPLPTMLTWVPILYIMQSLDPKPIFQRRQLLNPLYLVSHELTTKSNLKADPKARMHDFKHTLVGKEPSHRTKQQGSEDMDYLHQHSFVTSRISTHKPEGGSFKKCISGIL